jgi:energy-coupling factor transport system ATP-binding protein
MKEHGTTVILVSHSMEDMALYCDNVVVMRSGRLHAVGSVNEIFSDINMLTEVGLDAPEALRIANRLKAEGIELSGELYTANGLADAILKYKNGIGGGL